jgi:hypothetical protein
MKVFQHAIKGAGTLIRKEEKYGSLYRDERR